MSKQFSLYATDADLRALQAQLVGSWDADILSELVSSDMRDLLPLGCLDISQSQVGSESLFCFLAPRSLPRLVIARRIGSSKTVVDLDASHLIEFWRPYYDGKSIRAGRLFYQDKIAMEGGRVDKDSSFLRWANGIFGKIKKGFDFNRDLNAYMAPYAMEKISSGEIVVVGKLGD